MFMAVRQENQNLMNLITKRSGAYDWLESLFQILTIGDISHIIRKENMKLDKFRIEYYTKNDGSCPAQEFMDSLDIKMRARILRLQLLLEDNGNTLTEPYSKHLEEGIFELRAQQGNNIARILYFFVVGKKIIITNGFIKKTQKTSKKELKLAKQYRAEYLKKRGKKHEQF